MADSGNTGVSPEQNILILGVGNPFRRDDGIGPAVIRRLQSENSLQQVDLLDGGIDGFALLDQIKLYEKVLIVDAVDMGLKPGEIRIFSPAEAKMTIRTDALSTHGFGLAETLAFMETLEISTDVRILGIQAKDIGFGEDMTPEIHSQLDAIIETISTQLERW